MEDARVVDCDPQNLQHFRVFAIIQVSGYGTTFFNFPISQLHDGGLISSQLLPHISHPQRRAATDFILPIK